MAMARKFDIIDGASEVRANLRPADIHSNKMPSQAAGPFEALSDEATNSTTRDALVTGLLVIYPALAIVAAIVAGLYLAGASGT
jgi:hypothetical protein